MDLGHTVVVTLCLCLVSHGIAAPGQGNVCQKKCKECSKGGGIGPCVSECVKSGNPGDYDCFDQCNGEGGGNNCDVKTTNCVDTANGFKCSCKDEFPKRVDYILCEADVVQIIRLVGGTNAREGRVEVFHGGVWGTVCSDHWVGDDAKVVCRELGFSSIDAKACLYACFGEGAGIIHLDSVNCDGTESQLTQCSHQGWGNHDCGHDEDASVICQDVP